MVDPDDEERRRAFSEGEEAVIRRLARVTTVYLARHGESDWNAANRFQGHSDRPLTELGREQAEALADALAVRRRSSAIYSSPLRRALDTATAVAGARWARGRPG